MWPWVICVCFIKRIVSIRKMASFDFGYKVEAPPKIRSGSNCVSSTDSEALSSVSSTTLGFCLRWSGGGGRTTGEINLELHSR